MYKNMITITILYFMSKIGDLDLSSSDLFQCL